MGCRWCCVCWLVGRLRRRPPLGRRCLVSRCLECRDACLWDCSRYRGGSGWFGLISITFTACICICKQEEPAPAHHSWAAGATTSDRSLTAGGVERGLDAWHGVLSADTKHAKSIERHPEISKQAWFGRPAGGAASGINQSRVEAWQVTVRIADHHRSLIVGYSYSSPSTQ